MVREYVVLQPSSADIRARLAAIEPELTRRAIAKGIIRSEAEARIRFMDAEDLGKTVKEFTHTFSVAHTWEKYLDAHPITGKIIGFVGMWNESPDPKTIGVRLSVGVPLRPIFEAGLDGAYIQDQPKVLLTQDRFVEDGDKLTIELYGTATGDDRISYLALVCEKM